MGSHFLPSRSSCFNQVQIYKRVCVPLLFLVLHVSLDHDSQVVLGQEAEGQESAGKIGAVREPGKSEWQACSTYPRKLGKGWQQVPGSALVRRTMSPHTVASRDLCALRPVANHSKRIFGPRPIQSLRQKVGLEKEMDLQP